MTGKFMLVASIAVALGACGGGNKDQRTMEAAVDSMTRPRDSTIRAMDTTGAPVRVDTTKLRPAQTESILTKARKSP